MASGLETKASGNMIHPLRIEGAFSRCCRPWDAPEERCLRLYPKPLQNIAVSGGIFLTSGGAYMAGLAMYVF